MKTYVARQPIFDRDQMVFGYELLYRDSAQNCFNPNVGGDRATRAVVSEAITTFGINNLTYGKRAFINFTRALLLSNFPELLNPRDFVIEILETVEVDNRLLARVCELREKGYVLAMDDYTGTGRYNPLFEHVDIVKVDFILNTPKECARIAHSPALRGKTLLAEKVETAERFQKAMEDGYELFQGYFFAKPTVFSKSTAEISNATYMRVIREMARPNADFDRLAQIIRADVSLTYKLLRRINTLEYYRSHRVTSIKHALVRLGFRETRRWFLLVLMQDCARIKTNEIVKTSLVRGVFAEKIAQEMDLRFYDDEAYIVGMFSMIDSILEDNLTDILKEVRVSTDVQDALLGKDNALRRILDFIIAYERADWGAVTAFLGQNGLNAGSVTDCYAAAVQYADIAFGEGVVPEPDPETISL